MKNKKKVSSKIAIGIILLIILIMVFLSPNLIGRLLGNFNSIDTSSNEGVKTGVVLNLNKGYNYNNDNPIKMKIYNGSDGEITINSIVSRNYCPLSTDCDGLTITNLDTPIIAAKDEEVEYTITDPNTLASGELIDVGVQYSLTTDENGTQVTKIYNIVSTSVDINTPLNLNIEGINQEEKEFTINSSKGTNDAIYIKLSDVNIHMDKSEDLNDLNVYYSIKSDFGNSWFYDHPQTINATTNKLMFGELNKSNYKSIFTYTDSADRISGSGAFDYSNQFKLYGTPNSTYSNQDVILGFFFEQHEAGSNSNEYWSDETTPFSSSEIPHFTLTVYDKSSLKTAIENGIEKINSLDEEVDPDSWEDYLTQIVNAWILYNSRDEYTYFSNLSDSVTQKNYETREVTQTEIDNMVNTLNNTEITKRSLADYLAYNNLIDTIQSKQEAWYTPESYAEFKVVYDERSNYEGLSNTYQVKLDNYVAKLKNSFNNLVMYDADYTNVETAISKANLITNKTDDGKYDLYTKESWNALQNSINEVNYGLKIENQEIVDSYALAITLAYDNLEIGSAIYDDLKDVIFRYKDTEAYNNNWYTDETKNAVEDYLLSVTYDIKITNQSIVDTWTEELTSLVEALTLKKALGYLSSDDYHPFEGSLSIEEYINYLKELDKGLYTDYSLDKIMDIISKFNNNTDSINDITIDRQEEMDVLLQDLNDVINSLEKKPGDYTELCDYYNKALALNLDYYEDVSNLRQVLWNINWDYKIDEQSLIDAETEELRKALDALVMKDADYTEFNKAYKNAKNINSSYYTNYSIIEKAISQANSAKGLKIDKQSVVDETTSILNNALDSLVLKDADYSKINSLKVRIEQLDESKYTNFEIVKNALNTIVYGKKITEQDKVDNMYNKLKNAYDNLIKVRAIYTELENAIANAKKYESNKANYTNYQEVENLINSVNYNLNYDEQSKVDELTKQINEAVSKLNKKPANYTELSLVLSKIPSDYSSYDNDLKNEIKDLLEEVKKLPNDLKYDEQSKIDNLVSKAKNIINRLPVINSKENSSKVVLSYLKVNDEKVDISSVPFKYVVEYSVVEAKITVGLVSSNSTYKVYGGNVLMPGDNNVTIVVNTNDGKTYTYTLVITRKTTSDYLSDLSVKESNIYFNKNKQEYTIKIDKNTDKLDLSAIAEDENAKVTIKGNKNLKNGSKVQIEVESTDGSVRVYTLNVQKAGPVDVRVVIILIMVLAILSGVFKFIQVKKKIKEENNA